MSTRTITVPFAGPGTRELPGGRFLYIRDATAALDIEIADANGTPNHIVGAGAGLKFKRLDETAWRFTRLTSSGAQTVVLVLSDDAEVDIASTVTVSGAVTVEDIPASAVSDTAPVVRPDASQGVLCAASPSRKRITVFADQANAGVCYARTAGGANNIAPLVPGMGLELAGRYALDVRNDTGAPATFYIFEES